MTELRTVRFIVWGNPRGKARGRVGVLRLSGGAVRGMIFPDSKTKAEEGAVRVFAANAMAHAGIATQLEGALELEMRAFMPIPASWSNPQKALAVSRGRLPTGKPDLDNIMKLIKDGCNSVVYRDDAQVVRATACKFYSLRPRVEVIISEIAPG